MWGLIHIAPRETFCHKMFLHGATQASAAPEMRQAQLTVPSIMNKAVWIAAASVRIGPGCADQERGRCVFPARFLETPRRPLKTTLLRSSTCPLFLRADRSFKVSAN